MGEIGLTEGKCLRERERERERERGGGSAPARRTGDPGLSPGPGENFSLKFTTRRWKI